MAYDGDLSAAEPPHGGGLCSISGRLFNVTMWISIGHRFAPFITLGLCRLSPYFVDSHSIRVRPGFKRHLHSRSFHLPSTVGNRMLTYLNTSLICYSVSLFVVFIWVVPLSVDSLLFVSPVTHRGLVWLAKALYSTVVGGGRIFISFYLYLMWPHT